MRKQHHLKRAEGGQMYKIWFCETFAEDIQNLPRHAPVQPVLGVSAGRNWTRLSPDAESPF